MAFCRAGQLLSGTVQYIIEGQETTHLDPLHVVGWEMEVLDAVWLVGEVVAAFAIHGLMH